MTISDKLHQLGLIGVATQLDDILATATKKRWSHVQFLEHVAAVEAKDKARRSLERRLSRAKIGRFKSMEQFDRKWPKKIDRALVESSLALDFIEDARNVVIVSPHGLGKTMIAKNIAHQAVLQGPASHSSPRANSCSISQAGTLRAPSTHA